MKPLSTAPSTPSSQILGFDSSFDPLSYSKGKSHFQQAFSWVWSAKKRAALDSLYAYCRLCDDLADEMHWPESERRRALQNIRAWVRKEISSEHPFWSDFHHLIEELHLDRRALEDILDGVEEDFVTSNRDWIEFESWNQLLNYADRVASAVGLLVLNILEGQHPQISDYANPMGRCVQLLNIMRDLESDLREHRVYIPREFLEERGISPRGPWSHDQKQMMRAALYQRANQYYKSARAFSWSCLPAELMVGIYRFAARKYWFKGQSRKLSRFEKFWAAWISFVYFVISRRPASTR